MPRRTKARRDRHGPLRRIHINDDEPSEVLLGLRIRSVGHDRLTVALAGHPGRSGITQRLTTDQFAVTAQLGHQGLEVGLEPRPQLLGAA